MRTLVVSIFALSIVCVGHAATEGAATSGVVTRGGVELHYTVLGDRGPYLLVLSGGPGEEVGSMAGVAEHLRQRYRCVMLEQRGTGRSRLAAYDRSTINLEAYIEDVEALRKHLGVDKLVLLGNSWGMMLALAYGGAHPAAAKAIVTLGSGPISRDYLDVFAANQRMFLAPSDRELVELWSDPAVNARQPEQAAFERIRATAPAYFFDRAAALRYAAELQPSDFNPRVLRAFVQAEPQFDLRPLLRSISAPVLLLQGRQDLAGEANLYEAHLLIKSSVLTFINQCGHMPWLEKPAETWKATDDFLAKFAGD
jgi:proline iminopeptidase